MIESGLTSMQASSYVPGIRAWHWICKGYGVAIFGSSHIWKKQNDKKYEHTNVTINSGRARKPDLHACAASVFNTGYTTRTRGGAAEAGSAAEAGLAANSTGTPSCQQWPCGDGGAGQWSRQPAEATGATKCGRKGEAA
jgi:hypothetical protein